MAEKDPMGYAVMYTNSEFDYRIFANHDEATGFAGDCVLEEDDEDPEIIPLVSGIDFEQLRRDNANLTRSLNNMIDQGKLDRDEIARLKAVAETLEATIEARRLHEKELTIATSEATAIAAGLSAALVREKERSVGLRGTITDLNR